MTLGVSLVFLLGCAGSKVSRGVLNPVDHPIKTIAVAPSGGTMGDAIAVEFANRGYSVLDTENMAQLLLQLDIPEYELVQPQRLSALKEKGIDAYLIIRSEMGYDSNPQNAVARLHSTHTGGIIVGITWQNGHGGQAGSLADRSMRKGLVDAAAEIAQALLDAL